MDCARLLLILLLVELEKHPLRCQSNENRWVSKVRILFCSINVDLQRSTEQSVGDLDMVSSWKHSFRAIDIQSAPLI